jgi:predicted naringenin-chalcone synthase
MFIMEAPGELMPRLIDITTTVPPYRVSQERATAELKQRMGTSPAVGRMIDMAAARSGITTRRFVVPDAEPDVQERFYARTLEGPHPDTARRMALYRTWSSRLAVEATSTVLEKTRTSPASIDRLITVSCTGFSAPNFDYDIISRLGLPPSVKRTHIGFMGCAASLVGFTSVLEACQAPQPRRVLLVSVELCSLHLQLDPTRDNILANMIFADGCAASLFSSGPESPGRIRLVHTDSMLFENSREFMGWEIGNFGFEMKLSADLPRLISEHAVPAVRDILQARGLTSEKIRHWVLHPGGRAILDALESGLGLSKEQMEPSRNVLNCYGNMSSASILFVMKEMLGTTSIESGDLICAIGFGPGLTMEVALFEGV